ncbi:MsnO8 family LLM class oxidoreductase [Saccharopolyspora taberi]|uniref:LLM class flavin-dependent oxidoreductase n=1 Tax=Saccharopolyspora taberi TaxID=60895 RepID=A0ABN3VE26_9PSEU
MPAATPLSVLDLSPVVSGQTAADALRNTLDLAQHAERFGYRRFWLAEHHLAPGVASSSPAVLVAAVAGRTRTIRVGSGAVLLGNRTPLEVAEDFGTVAQLHPGRVDLGLGRSAYGRIGDLARKSAAPPQPAADRVVDGLLVPAPPPRQHAPHLVERLRTHAGLLGAFESGDYRDQVGHVLDFLTGRYHGEDGSAHRSAVAEGADLETWILGSSAGPSSRAAGELGLPFGANYHVTPSTVLGSIAAYREAFVPSRRLPRPHVMVSADVVVAEDEDTARELAKPFPRWVHSIRAGDGAIPFPSPAEADDFEWTDEARAAVDDRVRTQIVGTPRAVAAQLRVLRDATGADELLITTITHDHADRLRSYELLAEVW